MTEQAQRTPEVILRTAIKDNPDDAAALAAYRDWLIEQGKDPNDGVRFCNVCLISSLDDFTRSFLETALWATNDDDGKPLDQDHSPEDIEPESLVKLIQDCKRFQELNSHWTMEEYQLEGESGPEGYAGHDFFLTRCGHGAGFLDGGWEETAGEAMTKSSKSFGEVNLYVGDDGLIYN